MFCALRVLWLCDVVVFYPWQVVLKAVQADGSALMFASEELQRDKEKMGGRSSQGDKLSRSL